VILDVHGQALVGGIEARPLRYRPALEDPFELEPEVVVKACRGVLLNQVRAGVLARGFRDLTGGLRGFLEVALAPVLAKPHALIFP